MKRRMLWLAVVVLFLFTLTLAACQQAPEPAEGEVEEPAAGEAAEETEAPAEEEMEEPTEEAATEEPAEEATEEPAMEEPAAAGGDLIYALPSDIVSFDPHATRETVSGMVNSQIFDYLTILTPDGDVKGELADSWEVSDDELTWTFHLVQDAVFHDGTPVTAEAVKMNLDRVLDPDNALPASRLLAGVTEVNAVDDYTLEIVTEQPLGALLFHLSHYSLGIISPNALESMSAEELAQNPVGSGPFKFVSYTPNDSIVLEKNPDYWGTVPSLDTVTFRPVPEAATRSVLIETGEAQVVSKIAPQDVEFLQDVDGLHVDVIPFTRVVFIHMNEMIEPFGNVQVRQALSWAIDRQSIVDNVLDGLAVVATGPLGSGVSMYSPTDNYGYDPDKARELLAEAGYPDGFSTTMWVPQGRYQGAEEAAQAVQAQLAEVGVDVNLEIIEWSTLLENIRKGPDEAEWQMLMLGFAPATNDADWQLYTQFHCDNWAPVSNNRSFYCNPEVDALLEQGKFSTDPEVRREAYAELLNIVIEDAPELYLYQTTQIYGVRDNVEGLEYLPIDIQFLEFVSLSE
jgi:peptide/nickel transport system substrate-binding protein